MAGPSRYERLEIESLLRPDPPPAVSPGGGLALMPMTAAARYVHYVAVAPALRDNGLSEVLFAFDSESALATVHSQVMAAGVIVADVTGYSPDLMYVLGIAHGLGRCPLLICEGPADLPFDLKSLRHIEYEATSDEGMRRLRRELARAVRVFLAAARAKYPGEADD